MVKWERYLCVLVLCWCKCWSPGWGQGWSDGYRSICHMHVPATWSFVDKIHPSIRHRTFLLVSPSLFSLISDSTQFGSIDHTFSNFIFTCETRKWAVLSKKGKIIWDRLPKLECLRPWLEAGASMGRVQSDKHLSPPSAPATVLKHYHWLTIPVNGIKQSAFLQRSPLLGQRSSSFLYL